MPYPDIKEPTGERKKEIEGKIERAAMSTRSPLFGEKSTCALWLTLPKMGQRKTSGNIESNRSHQSFIAIRLSIELDNVIEKGKERGRGNKSRTGKAGEKKQRKTKPNQQTVTVPIPSEVPI